MQGDDNQSANYYNDSSSLSYYDESDHFEDEEDKNLGPLHAAAAKNDVQKLTQLISLAQNQGNEIDLNERHEFYIRTPLHLAAKYNFGSSHYEVAEVLLKNGADVNVGDYDDWTPLWYLVQNCNLDILKLFSRFKADFTHTDADGSSLLTPASYNFYNLDVLKFLIQDFGLDINHKNLDKWTPLHHVAHFKENDSHYGVLKCLLENGADVNARDEDGLTPLYYLVKYYGNWNVVELFIKHNADIHAVTKDGSSILFAFDSDYCDLLVLEKLIYDFGLDVNHQAKYKKTPLHRLIYNSLRVVNSENTKIVKCLLKNGANINAPDKYGVTPLMGILGRISRQDDDKWFLKHLDYISFLIGQVDFSVVYNDAHILKYYQFVEDDQEVDYHYHRFPEYLWKWILQHIAKLKFLNIQIHPIIQNYIKYHTNHKNYFKKCTEELELMNNTKLQNSWINSFNLLVDSRKKLKNYTGNEDLILDFKNSDWLNKFPIFGVSMKKNVEKGLRRRELFDESSILLSDCLPIFNPNHLIVKDIFDCILSKKDLSKFCE